MTNEEINNKSMERLKRIEGQVKGVANMIANGRYCVDIVTQVAAVESALKEVRMLILKRHMNNCVKDSLASGSKKERQEKIDELISLFSKFGK